MRDRTARKQHIVGLSLLIQATLSSSVYAATYQVNDQADERDERPGDGICRAASGNCTLRAALEEANALPGADTIALEDGYYILSLGQLDVTDDLTLQANYATIDADERSRVMEIYPGGWVIADNTNASVHLYTLAGVRKETLVGASSGFDLVTAIRPEGRKLAVLSLQSLRTFNTRTGALELSVPLPDDMWPTDAIYGPWPSTDNVYVLDYLGGRILRYPTAGGAASVFATSLQAPNSVIYAPSSTELLVTDTSGQNVQRFDIATGALLGTFVSDGLATPRGLLRAWSGNRLLVADEASNSVRSYDERTGARLGDFIPSGRGGLLTPTWLALGPEHDVYVASGGRDGAPRQILRYDGATGVFRGVLLNGGQPGPFVYVRGIGTAPRVSLRGVSLREGHVFEGGVPGGAIYSWHEGNHVTLTDCLIEDNEARVQGGGIHNQGFMRLERTRVSRNRTQSGEGGGLYFSGGGVFSAYGRLEIDSSLIDQNESTRGGGITNYSGTAIITNSVIESNKATARGGGILNIFGGELTLSFSTVRDNDAHIGRASADEPGFGGGIYNTDVLTLSNSIIAGNRDQRYRLDADFTGDCFNGSITGVAGGGAATLISLGGNVLGIWNAQCPHSGGPSDRFGVPDYPLDPRFAPRDEGGLADDSPALDLAVNASGPAYLACPALDQFGLMRPIDGDGDGFAHCDSGAHERAAHTRRGAMLVVGNTTLSAADAALADHLAGANYSLTIRGTGNLSGAEYEDVIVIAESVDSASLPSSLATLPVPILCLEPGFLDELQMTRLAWDVTQGAALGQSSLRVTSNALTGSLTGTQTVTTAPAKLGWGVPAGSAAILGAELANQPGHWAVFGYAPGAALANGTAAPAARVASFVADGTAPLLNATGWQLFDASLDWMLR